MRVEKWNRSTTRRVRYSRLARLMVMAWFSFHLRPATAQVDLAISIDDATTIGNVFIDGNELAGTDLNGDWQTYIRAVSRSLPAEVAINAMDWVPGSGLYFAVDTSAVIDGTLFADEDIIHWDGSEFVKAWDGSQMGVPREAGIDALDVLALSPLEISVSLDISAELPNVGLVGDEDIVHFREGSAPEDGFTALEFDGSIANVPAEADVDAFSRLTATEWLISFDIAGEIGGIGFGEGDLLLWNSETLTFNASPYFDAEDERLEPGVDIVAADGAGLLMILGVSRQDKTRSYLRYKE